MRPEQASQGGPPAAVARTLRARLHRRTSYRTRCRSLAVIATGLQQCLADGGDGTVDEDREQIRSRLEKLFLSLA